MKLLSLFVTCLIVLLGTVHAANLGVTVSNFAFTPSSTTIAPTDTVTWTRSAGTHNVHNTSVPTRFHNTIGGTWTTYVWPCTVAVGAYPYMCQVHATMTGTVSVARITMVVANGGENWQLGSFQTISWTSQNLAAAANVVIEINRTFPGGAWETIIASTPNDGSHSWTVTGATGATNRIRIRAVQTSGISGAIQDVSDADFTISAPPPPTIVLNSPNGGEVWPDGSVQVVSWTTENFAGGSVVIELNRSFPAGAWEVISGGAPDVSFFDFTVSGPLSTTCRVRVSKLGDSAVNDVSDANFEISGAGTITVATPNGGETLSIGSNYDIQWNSAGIGSVNIDLNRAYPGGSWESLATSYSPSPFTFVVTGPASTQCRVRITDAAGGVIMDESNADFTIMSFDAPTDLVIVTDDTDGRLHWRPVAGAAGYNVYRSLLADGPFTDLAGSTADTFFVDPGILLGNSRYFWQVRATLP